MPLVIRYRDLNTNLEELFKDVVSELQNEKELDIAKETTGKVNGVPFKSVYAVRATVPKVFLGTVREATVTITGKPEDYLIELHVGSFFENMIVPGATVTMLGGPLLGFTAAGTTGFMTVNFRRKLKNRIKELVKKNTKKEYTVDKVETFTAT